MKHMHKDLWKPLVFLAYIAVVYLLLLQVFGQAPEPTANPTYTVDDMTMEEKMAAIDEELKQEPMVEISAEEKVAETTAAEALLTSSVTTQELAGNFTARAHGASGSATLVNDNGDLQLVLSEDFKTEAGPQLHLFLSGDADPGSSDELHASGNADLGKLKSTTGAQVYDVPDDLDFDPASIVVYCVPFKVVFTTASLN